MDAKPPVVILCGGRGTRLRERTESVPKALVEIGGRPILWHVIQIYAAQGFDRFLLATGYMGEAVAEFAAAERWPEGVGSSASTPASTRRPAAGSPPLAGGLRDQRFCATYADGVADVDLDALLEFHAARVPSATVTVVRPNLQWGVAELDGDAVTGFVEKPRSEHWINGGFFCFEPGVLDYLDADSVLEREPLSRLAADGELRAFRHEGFWDCMDTYKDAVVLNDLWTGGRAPWRIWDAAAVEAVKRSLVTGGHGFVASNLARALLERGDAVTRPRPGAAAATPASPCRGSTSDVELLEADLRDAAAVDAAIGAGEFDVVFHLAAQTLVGPAMADPTQTFEVNVRGTWSLLEACRRADVPAVVVASSDKAYGPSEELPYREDMRLQPASPYEASKAAADAIALSYRPAYGLPVAVTRFANIYGGGDPNFSRLIPEAIAAVLDGRRPQIRSDGSPERDFLYVGDAVAAYLAVEQRGRRRRSRGGGGVQRRRRAPLLGRRGAGDDRRGLGYRPQPGIPRHRQPRR